MDALEPALAALVEQVREARARSSSLSIRGGGSKDFYGETPAGNVLDVRPLAGISSYEPSELVVTARAGTSLSELEAALEERGQFLPFEPPRFNASGTVGGMIAAGLAGPARAAVGSVRDHVLGLTLLNGRAEVLSFGGQVAKNVAGYDVSRLMVGALGILGVICEVSIKVLPRPKATETLCFDCDEREAHERMQGWASKPLPINATAWCDGEFRVRLSGASAAVSEAVKSLGGERLEPRSALSWWDDVRDHRHPFFVPTAAELERGPPLWRVSVPKTAAPLALPGRQFIGWHGGERWLRGPTDSAEVRRVAEALGGHATAFRRGAGTASAFHPLGEALLKIHRDLKRAFDPDRVFNPGRLYAGI